jgi:all-trans-retinol dehydrogenase (NAD+)
MASLASGGFHARVLQYLRLQHPGKSAAVLALLAFYVIRKLTTPFKDLKSQTVLITGAASGLGKQMAHRFAKLGCVLVLWDINRTLLDNVVEELRKTDTDVRAFGYVCDVSSDTAVHECAERVKVEHGHVDVLINNAGVVAGNFITDLTAASIKRTMGVNALSSFWTIKEFLPHMLELNRGHIVTIASAAGTVGVAKMTDYCASKFAAVGLTESLRNELKYRGFTGVHTTLVCPYYINTGMFAGVSCHPLLPMLEEKAVVSSIVRAVQTNTEVVNMPWINNLVPIFRLLPTSVFDGIGTMLKLNRSMETFAGRSIQPPPVTLPKTDNEEKRIEPANEPSPTTATAASGHNGGTATSTTASTSTALPVARPIGPA